MARELLVRQPYSLFVGDDFLTEACSSSPDPIEISVDAAISRDEFILWRAYARRAARYLAGVRFRDRKGRLSPLSETSLDQEAISVANRAGLALQNHIHREAKFLAGSWDERQFYLSHIGFGRGHPRPEVLYTKEYVDEGFDGNRRLLRSVLDVLVPKQMSEPFFNLWARQGYQRHLGHVRVLQNLHLLRVLGIRPNELVNKKAVEFGPGVGGLYPILLANKCETTVVDKNAAIRLIARLRGASEVHEMEFGRASRDGETILEKSRTGNDFVFGIGILNVFAFTDYDSYTSTVSDITSLVAPGGKGVWVTYNQPSQDARSTPDAWRGPCLESRAIFIRNGWKDVTEEVGSDLLRIGLDYRYGADFRVFTLNV